MTAEISTPSKTYRKRAKRGRPKTRKTCCECGESKPLSEYHKGASNADGKQTRCKTCANARNRSKVAANGRMSGGIIKIERYREGTSRTYAPGDLCRWGV